jgi:hypothetical protein
LKLTGSPRPPTRRESPALRPLTRGISLLAGAVAALCLLPAVAVARPPVVMIVFDEFPTTSLEDGNGRIDPVRYPAFASLARDGVWFPNATASVDETGRAMESLLTGNLPERKHPVTWHSNKRNLFTLLARRYRIRASEEVTSMCPVRLCPGNHLHTKTEVLHELAGGRPERFGSWLRSLRRSRRPTFFFKHVLFPHVPLRYLPSGRAYGRDPHEPIPGIVGAFRHRWLIVQAFQRHLLQLAFTDRLLGRALQRLRQRGLYDRSLVVVTADNGESFGTVGDRHVITRRNAANIALTPLFVKLPHQRHGRVADRHVRTVDVLPTIARLARVRVRWRTQGHPVFGRFARRIPGTTTLIQRSGHRFRLSRRALRRAARRFVRQKLALFGSGPVFPALYRVGPYPSLLSRPVAQLAVQPARRSRVVVNERAAVQAVSLRSGLVPAFLTGRLSGRAHRDLAVAVNGYIAATVPSFRRSRRGPQLFSALIPEEIFHDGHNQVDIFAVSRPRDGLHLLKLK